MIKPLHDLASRPYQRTGRVNFQWARGKLRGDPIFKALTEHAIFSDNSCVLDLGCGKGLLAAWLLAAEKLADAGECFTHVRPARNLSFRGIDIDARDVRCGNAALKPLYNERIELTIGDMRRAQMRDVDAVVLLDVLHYIPYGDQDRLLDDIRAALGSGGVLLTRVSDARFTFRVLLTKFVDRCVLMARGHGKVPLYCRSLPDWMSSLEKRGFTVRAIPMSQSTPFANVMLIARAI